MRRLGGSGGVTATRDREVEAFVRAQRPGLVRSATALTAGDRHLAEDLVQSTLVRLYVSWPRLQAANPDAYVRRSLVNAWIDHTRRPFTRRERVWADPPDTPTAPVGPGTADERLLAALAALGPGMRAVVVLRHVEGLSVDETAAALGCSAGNVKSQNARGLERLRTLLQDAATRDTPDVQGATRCAT